MTEEAMPPLPDPWDYCYEWHGPYGTRKFSSAAHNGMTPDSAVPLFTAEQMHTYAADLERRLQEARDIIRGHEATLTRLQSDLLRERLAKEIAQADAERLRDGMRPLISERMGAEAIRERLQSLQRSAPSAAAGKEPS